MDELLSSGALLRRNWADLPFTPVLGETQRRDGLERVYAILSEVPESYYLLKLSDLDEGTLGPLCALPLLGDPAQRQPEARVFLAKGEETAVFVNAEDHLLFAARDGAEGSAVQRVERLSREVSGEYRYAYAARHGYLTTRPLHAGTGLHLCYLLHLPLLQMLHQLRAAEEYLAREYGFSLSPLQPAEGRNPSSLYFLYNRGTRSGEAVPLTDTAQKALEWLKGREGELRRRVFSGNPNTVYADQVFRAYGLLKYVRRLGPGEFLALWSKLRLGALAGLLPVTPEQADRILLRSRKGKLLGEKNGAGGEKTLNFLRADMVREELNGGK